MRTCVREKTANNLTHISCLSIPDVTSLAALARWVLPCARYARECPLGARWVLVGCNKAPPLFHAPSAPLCRPGRVGARKPVKRRAGPFALFVRRRGQRGKGRQCPPLVFFIGYGVCTKVLGVGSAVVRCRALRQSLQVLPRSLARPRQHLYPQAFCIHPYAWP